MKILLPILGLYVLSIEASQRIPDGLLMSYRYYRDCRSSDDDAQATNTARIRKHLFCDPPTYDFYNHPNANDNRPTLVKLQVLPQSIDFDDLTLRLRFNTWFSKSWVDPRLTWTKDKFPNIKSISIPSRDIWTPSLSSFNKMGVEDYQTTNPSTDCLLTMNGTVSCVQWMEPEAECAPDYQHWPFDILNCTIKFGSWVYASEDSEFEVSSDKIKMSDDYTENLEWKILSVNSTKAMHQFKGSMEKKPLVLCNIILERHSANRKATVVVPAIVLIIMTLSVLWMDPMSVERMMMAGLNVICHLLGLMGLYGEIPSNGASLPSILIFYKNSLVIAGVAFFLTAFLRQLKKISIPAPDWFTLTTSVILSTKAGQFVLLSTLDPKASATLETAGEDNAGLVQSNSSHSNNKVNTENVGAWYHLATLLDRLSFVGVLITYVITLFVLIPKNKTYY